MRKKTYVIQSMINPGYWDDVYGSFRGYLYATHYQGYSIALEASKDLKVPITILTIYSNEKSKG